MRNSLKLILCDFLFSSCDFKNGSVQLGAASKVCYNAKCWNVATLESSAMLSAELYAVFIDIRSCFYEMACDCLKRKKTFSHTWKEYT